MCPQDSERHGGRRHPVPHTLPPSPPPTLSLSSPTAIGQFLQGPCCHHQLCDSDLRLPLGLVRAWAVPHLNLQDTPDKLLLAPYWEERLRQSENKHCPRLRGRVHCRSQGMQSQCWALGVNPACYQTAECPGYPTSYLRASVSTPMKWDTQAHIWGQYKDCMLQSYW